MSKKFKTRQINIGGEGGESVTVDHDLHQMLNALAGRFYEVLGYAHTEDFDYYTSSHPMEVDMYKLALIAYMFNLDIGLE